jgi:hypothetical protein
MARREQERSSRPQLLNGRSTVEMWAPRMIPGLHIRTNRTTLYTSIFRVDDDMIANFHIYGAPDRDSPTVAFARTDEPRL